MPQGCVSVTEPVKVRSPPSSRCGQLRRPAKIPMHLADVRHVVGVGPLVEVAPERGDGLAEPAHPAEQERRDRGRARDRSARGRASSSTRRARPASRGARDARPGGCAGSGRGSRAGRPAGASPRGTGRRRRSARRMQRLAVVGRQAPAAVGRIEEEAVGPADDEVAGQPDPDERQPEPPGDLELDDREADRQADPAGQHDVELAVARVAVLGGGRPAEAGLAIQDVVEAVDDVRPARRRASRRIRTRSASASSAPRVGARSIVRPPIAAMHERAEREVDVRLRPRDEPREPGAIRRAAVVDPAGTHPRGIVAPRRESGLRADRSAPDRLAQSRPSPSEIRSADAEPTCRRSTVAPGLVRPAAAPGRPPGAATSRRPIDRRIRRPVHGAPGDRPRSPGSSAAGPIRLADIVDRLNATLPRLALPGDGRRRRRRRAPGELDGRLPQRSGHRRSRTGRTGRRSRSRTPAASIRGSSARPSARPPPAASGSPRSAGSIGRPGRASAR